jgi:hypothetical protein
MKDKQNLVDSTGVSRRDVVRKGAKAAYIVPVVMAAIKATERPAFAQFSCAPGSIPAPDGMCIPAVIPL